MCISLFIYLLIFHLKLSDVREFGFGLSPDDLILGFECFDE